MRTPLFLLAAVAFAVTACQPAPRPADSSNTQPPIAGAEVSPGENVANVPGAEIPADYPADVPYLSAQLQQAERVETADGVTYTLVFQATGTTEEVINFYHQQYDAAGWQKRLEVGGTSAMISYQRDKQQLELGVGPAPGGAGLRVTHTLRLLAQ